MTPRSGVRPPSVDKGKRGSTCSSTSSSSTNDVVHYTNHSALSRPHTRYSSSQPHFTYFRQPTDVQYAASHPFAPHVHSPDQDSADSWSIIPPVDELPSDADPDSWSETHYAEPSSGSVTPEFYIPELQSAAELIGAGTEDEAVVEDYDSVRSSLYRASLQHAHR